jgi:NTP pyrophosphatase (non-canonical NTP hydrolase)
MRFDGRKFDDVFGGGNIPYKEPEVELEQCDKCIKSPRLFSPFQPGALDTMNDDEYQQMAANNNASRIESLKEELERRHLENELKRQDKQKADRGSEYIAEKADEWSKEHMPDWVDDAVAKQLVDERENLEKGVVERPIGQMNLTCVNGEGVFAEGTIVLDLPITFEKYQACAKKTAIYNQDARVLYPALGLAGETGEVLEKAVNLIMMAVHAGKLANQVKKIIRDDDCECDTYRKHAIGKEIGGVLWYCSQVASDLGLDLGAIAQENLDILADRRERGKIQGDGDNR